MDKRTRQLHRENQKMKWELNEANAYLMQHISEYLKTKPISRYQQEQVWRDVALMLLDGQQRGRHGQEVLGDDMGAFCDAVIAALPEMTETEKKRNTLRVILLVAFVVVLAEFLLIALNQYALIKSYQLISISTGRLISMLLILGVFLFFEIVWSMQRTYDGLTGKELAVMLVCIFVCNIPARIWTAPLFDLPLWLVVCIIGVLGAAWLIADAKTD